MFKQPTCCMCITRDIPPLPPPPGSWRVPSCLPVAYLSIHTTVNSAEKAPEHGERDTAGGYTRAKSTKRNGEGGGGVPVYKVPSNLFSFFRSLFLFSFTNHSQYCAVSIFAPWPFTLGIVGIEPWNGCLRSVNHTKTTTFS